VEGPAGSRDENNYLVPTECDFFRDRGITLEVPDDNTRLDVPNNNLGSVNAGYGVSMDVDMGKQPME